MKNQLIALQKKVCARFKSEFVDSPGMAKVGMAMNVREGIQPLNGLRHPPVGDTTGWYIWAGQELLQTDDFFAPLHVEHLQTWCPQILPYLGLAPGWRFLIAPDHEDVWYDSSLLDIE